MVSLKNFYTSYICQCCFDVDNWSSDKPGSTTDVNEDQHIERTTMPDNTVSTDQRKCLFVVELKAIVFNLNQISIYAPIASCIFTAELRED